ncbi:hypothetical protein ABMA10_06165 [Plantibacter sp. RU18]
MQRLAHDGQRVVPAGRSGGDQEHRGSTRVALGDGPGLRLDGDPGGCDTIGRQTERGQLHPALFTREEQPVERAREPQPLEVVVRRHDGRPGVHDAAQEERRHQPGREEVRADDGGRAEPSDGADDRHRVRLRPRVERAASAERCVAQVVAPLHEPRRLLDEDEVPLAQHVAVERGARLEDVEHEHLGDVGPAGARLLDGGRRAVVP